ncbi:hypothetical protein OESDEN_24644 [Oesophagostomum dentatum]|uniref:NR LBD domain-containing protein n=1 Tax=Oesophagostomum dentatum TaxID=61180 RepID=A0A0B1RVS1_OESDE|nr:hypothetical protein OESDEN_24644 [Oesophagostomum dentatum]
MRDRIQETLYHVVRETHPKEVASSRFGNLLLFIPSVMMLGSLVCENLQVVDSFGHMPDLLMHDVLREIVVDGSKTQQSSENSDSSEQHQYGGGMLHSASSTSVESLSGYSGSYPGSEPGQGLPYK